MSVILPVERARPAALPRSIAKAATGVIAFALVAGSVAFVRTFVFEYFHGDPAALHGLLRTIFGT